MIKIIESGLIIVLFFQYHYSGLIFNRYFKSMLFSESSFANARLIKDFDR